MTDFKATLTQLHHNLNILREREAKYGGNPPLEAINPRSMNGGPAAIPTSPAEGSSGVNIGRVETALWFSQQLCCFSQTCR